jgi:hypothetical protein
MLYLCILWYNDRIEESLTFDPSKLQVIKEKE